MGRSLFIRDDDVWTLDTKFRYFFDLALERRVPVVYAVIPGKMDKGVVRFLRRAKERTPRLLDIVQHGWVHADHSSRLGKKYEFGSSRSLKSQREDIEQGFKQMRFAFGELFTPAFVPPYHGYDARTLRALEEKDFWAFSIGKWEKECRLLQLPAGISFTLYNQDGSRSINFAEDMVEMLAKSLSQYLLPGILAHHDDFKTTAARKELTRFFDLLERLTKKREWQVILFSDLKKEMTND